MGILAVNDSGVINLNFEKISRGDKYISAVDLKLAMEDKTIPAEKRATLQVLLDHMSEIQKKSNDQTGFEEGISWKDFQSAYHQAYKDRALIDSSMTQMLLMQIQRKRETKGRDEDRGGE